MKIGLKASRWYLYFIPASLIMMGVILAVGILSGDYFIVDSNSQFSP